MKQGWLYKVFGLSEAAPILDSGASRGVAPEALDSRLSFLVLGLAGIFFLAGFVICCRQRRIDREKDNAPHQ